jgi:hypothetical protein
LKQAPGLVEIDPPADTEHPIGEQAVGVRVPIRRADAFPCWGPKVIRNDAPNPTVPGSLLLRLGKLGCDRGDEEADDSQANQAAKPT